MSQSKHTYDSDRQEALDFERLKMTISGHYDATSRLRERIVTVASVIFGLALIATQVENPERSDLSGLAILLVALSIIIGLLGGFVEVLSASDSRVKSSRAWLTKEPFPEMPKDSSVRTLDVMFLMLALFFLISGLIALIMFLGENAGTKI